MLEFEISENVHLKYTPWAHPFQISKYATGYRAVDKILRILIYFSSFVYALLPLCGDIKIILLMD